MQVIVDKHTVTINKNEIINEREYNVQACNFQFSSEYDGLPKIAIFKTDTVTKQILLSGDSCITPSEVLETTGIVGLGVYAYENDGDNLILRYSPTPAVFTVEPGSYDEGDAPTPPTPSVIEQLQAQITENANNISSLQDVTSTHTTQIETLQTDVNNIKAEQITQNQNIQTNANNIQTNTTDIANIKSEQITQNQNISQNTNNITNIKSEQVTQNTNIQNNTNNISALQTGLSSEITNRQNADINLQSQIDAITSSSDVVDIVGTYAQLQSYDTQHLQNNDVIKVLQDETHDNAMTYYRWDKHNSQWIYIGQEGPYYTKSETDTLLQGKANVNDVYSKSQIDTKLEDYALKTDLNDFVTEQDVDTKLEDYVETTTYTQGQASQDANIEENATNINWLQTLVNQMPTVSGSGTDLSLQDVLNYRLMKFLPQGNSSQFSTRGVQLFDKNNANILNKTGLGGSQNLIYSTTSNSKTLYISCEQNTTYTISKIISSRFAVATCEGLPRIGETLLNIITDHSASSITITAPNDAHYLLVWYYREDLETLTEQQILDSIQIEEGSTATSYEPYTGGVPAPNPSYPYPVKSVAGENVLKISNSNNTETQSYSISLGNIELNSSPDGTIRDTIIGKPNEWYKREYIGKVVLKGSENGWGQASASTWGSNSFIINKTLIRMDAINWSELLCPYLKSYSTSIVKNLNNEIVCGSVSLVVNNANISNLEDFKAWLQEKYNSNMPVTVLYIKSQYTDIPITDTTLINQLNNIYNNAHSYNGVTNITTTYADGNEQMYLDIDALKDVWSTTSTVSTLSAPRTTLQLNNQVNIADVDINDVVEEVKKDEE